MIIPANNREISVNDFLNTSLRLRQYSLMISSIPVKLSILSIPVIDFVNTGEGTFSKIWASLSAKSKILKTWEFLETCLDSRYRIKNITDLQNFNTRVT